MGHSGTIKVTFDKKMSPIRFFNDRSNKLQILYVCEAMTLEDLISSHAYIYVCVVVSLITKLSLENS